MSPLRFIDRVKFFLERQFVKGAFFQLVLVALAIGLISLTGGLLVRWWGSDFDDAGAAVWWAFLRLTDPGYLGDDEGTWMRVVSTWLTVSGYVVFLGALVAIMTRWLIALMTNLERGLTPVGYRHHVVVLGWSSRTRPLLAKLLGSSTRMRRFLQQRHAGRLRLVVLADDVSPEQRHQLASHPGIGRRANEVVLRYGASIDPEALRRVACFDAAAVIIPSSHVDSDELLTADMQSVKAVLTIAAQARTFQRELPYVVAEVREAKKRSVMQQAYPGEIEVVAGDELISRLLVQIMCHPGLSTVVHELMVTADGNEFYLRPAAGLAGETIGRLQSRLPRAVLMGLLRRHGGHWQAQLNPGWQSTLQSDDILVLLARDSSDTEPGSRVGLADDAGASERRIKPQQAAVPSRLLILGWNRRLPAILAELAAYAQKPIEVDVVSVVDTARRQAALKGVAPQLASVTVNHLQGDYLAEDLLQGLPLGEYQTVLLPSSDRLSSGEQADARVMVGYLELAANLARSSLTPQIIVELMDPDNRDLLPANVEVMLSPVILSHALAQAAMQREIRLVYEELFTPGGAEIVLIPPEQLAIPARMSFRRLQQQLASQGLTALGIQRASKQQQLLKPAPDEDIALAPGDRLVVLVG